MAIAHLAVASFLVSVARDEWLLAHPRLRLKDASTPARIQR